MVGVGDGANPHILFSEHDLKSKLLKLKPKSITITLDCCRDQKRGAPDSQRTSLVLGEKKEISMEEEEKIFILNATLGLHRSNDVDSFTKELYKVTNQGRKAIKIDKITKKVNDSWKARGIEQRSTEKASKGGEASWKTSTGPHPALRMA